METVIEITGQVNGNFKLRSACCTTECTDIKKHFQNFTLVFKTKKDAVKALSEAYQYLKSDKEDWEASIGSYLRGYSLNYDASRAKIIS